jgi:hypothetical protein
MFLPIKKELSTEIINIIIIGLGLSGYLKNFGNLVQKGSIAFVIDSSLA